MLHFPRCCRGLLAFEIRTGLCFSEVMVHLIIVSLVWAFSFSLIKEYLMGLDPSWVAAARLLIAWLVFLPFWKPGRAGLSGALKLMAIGAVQYGLMYLFYMRSFQTLPAHQVALFTLTTPVWIALLSCLGKRFPKPLHWGAILLSMLACAWMIWPSGKSLTPVWEGFMWIQLSNLCFAAGQMAFRLWNPGSYKETLHQYGWVFLGGVLATAYALPQSLEILPVLTAPQYGVLILLGILASGWGFFLWNRGATQVGPVTLSILNNLKIPLAVLVSTLVFGESADPLVLAGGCVLFVVAFYLGKK